VSDLALESSPSSPPPPPPPLPPKRKDSGWLVDPAPEGRRTPARSKRPMIPSGRRFIWFVLALLALNLVVSFMTGRPEEAGAVPAVLRRPGPGRQRQGDQLPGGLHRGRAEERGHVQSPGDAEPVEVTRFETEVPAFIDPAELTRLPAEQNVVINAEAPDEGRSVWVTLVPGFLPTILLVGFFIWLFRRQTGAGGGGILGGFGRSMARQVTPGAGSESASMTSRGSTKRSTSSSRSLIS
jgi:cell division protease FtsH